VWVRAPPAAGNGLGNLPSSVLRLESLCFVSAGIAAVKTAMLGAAVRQGAVSAEQLPGLMADGANLHKVRRQTSADGVFQTKTGRGGVS